MLKVLTALLHDPVGDEARLLKRLRAEAPELPEWSAAVQPIVERLRTHNALRRPLVCCVLPIPFNAFALPYQTIVLAQAMVEFCRDEPAQMAFVVAHEVAHISLGHATKQHRANAVTGLLRVAHPLVGLGLRFLLNRAFSREQELEADELAVTLCVRAGYAANAGIAFLERIAALEPATGIGQWLSTHPPTRERIAQLRER
jgi:predicted Zn-dependent protease